jgi:hypothetical protein
MAYRLESLSIKEMLPFLPVLFVNAGQVNYFASLTNSSIVPPEAVRNIVRRRQAVAVLALGHWTLLYEHNSHMYMFDSTALHKSTLLLQQMGINCVMLRTVPYQKPFDDTDKMCGQYVVFASSVVPHVVTGLSKFLSSSNSTYNKFCMDMLTCIWQIGEEFAESGVKAFADHCSQTVPPRNGTY